MKPTFGPQIFGVLACQRLKTVAEHETIVITDSGFRAEAEPIVQMFGPKNCYKIEIYREGCDFVGDSRSYWPYEELFLTKNVVALNNNFPNPDEFVIQGRRLVQSFIELDQAFGTPHRSLD